MVMEGWVGCSPNPRGTACLSRERYHSTSAPGSSIKPPILFSSRRWSSTVSGLPNSHIRRSKKCIPILVPIPPDCSIFPFRSEEHTSELQSRGHLVCRLLLEKKKKRRANLLS